MIEAPDHSRYVPKLEDIGELVELGIVWASNIPQPGTSDDNPSWVLLGVHIGIPSNLGHTNI